MSKKNYYFLIATFLGSFALAFLLTRAGCNRSFMEMGDEKPEQTQAIEQSESAELSLDERIDLALSNIEKGMAENNPTLMMQEGVFKLREIEAEDPENEKVLYHLGKLSLQSGQFEKAEVRFKKLILLQPSNEEYQNLLEEAQRGLESK